MLRWLLALAVCGLVAMPASSSEPSARVLKFEDLRGWATDDHDRALSVFTNTCIDMRRADWAPLCALAQDQVVQRRGGRAFFELFFRPVLLGGEDTALFTAYFEPELNGSRTRGGAFQHPVYRKPPEISGNTLWRTRAEIENDGVLAGRGLEIAWVDDPVELFFLQIQGSGRIKLQDGSVIRLGFGGSNGHEYRSIGAEMVRRGIYQPHQVSAQVIQNWVRRNPTAGRSLLQHSPGYVFFRIVDEVPAELGPLGAMNRSITTMRTVAVDPRFTQLGAPVWIEKDGRNPIRRLMVAQDTGSAIKGPQRADIFFGTGEVAGRAAGQVRDPGRMVVLMPIQWAFAMATED